jgi:hypothetical protein
MNSETEPLTHDAPVQETLGELEARLQHELKGRVRNFTLTRLDHGLVLKGHSHSYYAKQIAQHAVMEATDLPILLNEIHVH